MKLLIAGVNGEARVGRPTAVDGVVAAARRMPEEADGIEIDVGSTLSSEPVELLLVFDARSKSVIILLAGGVEGAILTANFSVGNEREALDRAQPEAGGSGLKPVGLLGIGKIDKARVHHTFSRPDTAIAELIAALQRNPGTHGNIDERGIGNRTNPEKLEVGNRRIEGVVGELAKGIVTFHFGLTDRRVIADRDEAGGQDGEGQVRRSYRPARISEDQCLYVTGTPADGTRGQFVIDEIPVAIGVREAGVQSKPLGLFSKQVDSPMRRRAMIRVIPAKPCQRRVGDGRIQRRAGLVKRAAGIFFEVFPPALPEKLEAGSLHLASNPVFVLLATDVFKERKNIAAGIEEIGGGQCRTILDIARIAAIELEAALRKQRELMILHATLEVLPMLAKGDSEARVEIVVQPPIHFVAVLAIFLHPQIAELVGIVAQALGVEDDLVEILALAVARVDRQRGTKYAQAVQEIHIAPVFAAITIYVGKAIAGLKRLPDVVVAYNCAPGGADGFHRRCHGLLGEECEQQEVHRRKL